MTSTESALAAPLSLAGLTISNRRASFAKDPSQAFEFAHAGRGLVVARPFAAPRGAWLSDEPPEAWRERADQIHSETQAVLMAQLVVEGGAGLDPLIYAGQRIATAGFDLLELVPSESLRPSLSRMLEGLRLGWTRPLVCRVPLSAITPIAHPGPQTFLRANPLPPGLPEGALGLSMLSIDIANGPVHLLAAVADLRAAAGLPLLAYCTPEGFEGAAQAVAAGSVDIPVRIDL